MERPRIVRTSEQQRPYEEQLRGQQREYQRQRQAAHVCAYLKSISAHVKTREKIQDRNSLLSFAYMCGNDAQIFN